MKNKIFSILFGAALMITGVISFITTEKAEAVLRPNYAPRSCMNFNNEGELTGYGNTCKPSANRLCLLGNACATSLQPVRPSGPILTA